jgi:hypothetical protein
MSILHRPEIGGYWPDDDNRPTPDATKPYPWGFNLTRLSYEYWTGTAWVQTEGGGGGGGGVTEPGMMCYIEPYKLEESSYGFLITDPAVLLTDRPLTVDEVILLRVQQDLGVPTEIGPANEVATYAFGDLFAFEFWFDLSMGSLVVPLGLSQPPQIVGHIGVYDTAAATWTDLMSIRIQGPWA